jgi:hypothetical protein
MIAISCFNTIVLVCVNRLDSDHSGRKRRVWISSVHFHRATCARETPGRTCKRGISLVYILHFAKLVVLVVKTEECTSKCPVNNLLGNRHRCCQRPGDSGSVIGVYLTLILVEVSWGLQDRVPLLARRSTLGVVILDSIASLFRGSVSTASKVLCLPLKRLVSLSFTNRF